MTMATRRIIRGKAERDGDVYLGVFAWLAKTAFRIVMIPLLLMMGRPSLALFLWGPGWVLSVITVKADADSNMYRRKRWREARKPVYHRNKNDLGGGTHFVCEATGYRSTDLGDFHVDHYLPRSRFPLLAYDQSNLRLIKDKVNIDKSDALHAWPLVRFFFMRRSTVIIVLAAVALAVGRVLTW